MMFDAPCQTCSSIWPIVGHCIDALALPPPMVFVVVGRQGLKLGLQLGPHVLLSVMAPLTLDAVLASARFVILVGVVEYDLDSSPLEGLLGGPHRPTYS